MQQGIARDKRALVRDCMIYSEPISTSLSMGQICLPATVSKEHTAVEWYCTYNKRSSHHPPQYCILPANICKDMSSLLSATAQLPQSLSPSSPQSSPPLRQEQEPEQEPDLSQPQKPQSATTLGAISNPSLLLALPRELRDEI
jgi:hypothetical protein